MAGGTSELSPCPFCKGERITMTYEYDDAIKVYFAQLQCLICGSYGPIGFGDTKEEASEDARWVWNRRAERTCHLIDCPPSTCARKEGWATWPKCSECGEAVRRKANYCSNCGAKVVDS